MVPLLLIHKACVLITAAGFILRWILSLNGSGLLSRPWLRVTPHVVDTILLLSGLGMLWALEFHPLSSSWLQAKLLALLAYILLGHLALKRRYSRPFRLVSGICALAALGYMIAVALTRNPLPWA